eukprot:TRINITY_DN930_c0_g1_i2.p1 TRINITY_DN930_c0_g1~~TRINITY_DN930_c0_g1_i2.p1  ORF type:complete len:195 (-),score=19.42 TRINITY_DN930_c0_g1_i2:310-819(-)
MKNVSISASQELAWFETRLSQDIEYKTRKVLSNPRYPCHEIVVELSYISEVRCQILTNGFIEYVPPRKWPGFKSYFYTEEYDLVIQNFPTICTYAKFNEGLISEGTSYLIINKERPFMVAYSRLKSQLLFSFWHQPDVKDFIPERTGRVMATGPLKWPIWTNIEKKPWN